MLPITRSLRSFIDKPFDRALSLPNVFAWQEGTRRNGVLVFGTLDTALVDVLFQLFEIDVHPQAGPHVSVVDFRGVTYIDLPAMEMFLAKLRVAMPRFATLVRKRLILCPEGGLGILVGGLRFQLPNLYEVRLATDLAPHLSWLEIDEDDAILAWSEDHRRRVSLEDAVDRRYRFAFDAGATSLDACAKLLATSVRGLQRSLETHGTTFRAVRLRWRIGRAKVLLANSRLSLTQVAFMCGFASQQSFTTAFRMHVGTTPAAFRKRAGPIPQQG